MTIAMAMLALGAEPQISLTAIQKDLKKNWPNLPRPGDAQEKDATFAFRVGEADVILGLMPAPIPWSDLEGPCATSWLWPEAAKVLRKHKNHLIVTVSSEWKPIERATLLTQVMASTIGTCESVLGVFWTDATLVVQPGMFREMAVDLLPAQFPVPVWIDFRVGKNDEGGSTGFTAGLAAFGHKEFETLHSTETPGELRERLLGLAGYVLENGPVIRDGDTIGQDENEKIKVWFKKSKFGHPDKVMRLVYPKPTKPWWKFW